MQPDEFQLNDSDPKYAALNDTEISALIKASTVSPFTPSEKVKQAPINFQKKTLAELAQLSRDEAVRNEPPEQSALLSCRPCLQNLYQIKRSIFAVQKRSYLRFFVFSHPSALIQQPIAVLQSQDAHFVALSVQFQH